MHVVHHLGTFHMQFYLFSRKLWMHTLSYIMIIILSSFIRLCAFPDGEAVPPGRGSLYIATLWLMKTDIFMTTTIIDIKISIQISIASCVITIIFYYYWLSSTQKNINFLWYFLSTIVNSERCPLVDWLICKCQKVHFVDNDIMITTIKHISPKKLRTVIVLSPCIGTSKYSNVNICTCSGKHWYRCIPKQKSSTCNPTWLHMSPVMVQNKLSGFSSWC